MATLTSPPTPPCARSNTRCVSTTNFEYEAYGTGATPADYEEAEAVITTYSYGVNDPRSGVAAG